MTGSSLQGANAISQLSRPFVFLFLDGLLELSAKGVKFAAWGTFCCALSPRTEATMDIGPVNLPHQGINILFKCFITFGATELAYLLKAGQI
jgi:hypothetical protein